MLDATTKFPRGELNEITDRRGPRKELATAGVKPSSPSQKGRGQAFRISTARMRLPKRRPPTEGIQRILKRLPMSLTTAHQALRDKRSHRQVVGRSFHDLRLDVSPAIFSGGGRKGTEVVLSAVKRIITRPPSRT